LKWTNFIIYNKLWTFKMISTFDKTNHLKNKISTRFKETRHLIFFSCQSMLWTITMIKKIITIELIVFKKMKNILVFLFTFLSYQRTITKKINEFFDFFFQKPLLEKYFIVNDWNFILNFLWIYRRSSNDWTKNNNVIVQF
jgi:hypothetical protein